MAVEGFSKTTRSTLKRRREEVAARLAAYGLARGPHRVARAPGVEGSHGQRLRLALEGLGPVFSAFGRYLSTRVDLFPASDCLSLAAIPDRAPPAPPSAARDVFRLGLGFGPEEAFPFFEEQPFESRLLYQTHRASLPNGAPVAVRVIRPETERQFLLDVELLHLLEGALADAPHGAGAFRDALADFVAALGQQLDFTHEAKALETLARDAEEFEMLRVPEVQRGLCAQGVLTVEELVGIRLDAGVGAAGPGARRGLPSGFDRTSLARLICSVWLRQALLGQVFPVEPTPENVVVLSERRIAFTGGLFAGLPAESQSNLWDYLIATASENPDGACSHLLREMRREGAAAAGGDEDLRHRFRQVVPFRDSEWYGDDDVSHLVEHLVVHWRAADEFGYVPLPHLPSFYRGLFAVTRSARQLLPERDPLREGLQDARLLASLAQVREMMTARQLGDQLDKYAALMMGMPQRLDAALTLASEGGARLKLRVPETTSHRRQKNSSATVAALLLLLAAVVMLLPHLMASLVTKEWANRVNVVVFILVGAMVLRAASRA